MPVLPIREVTPPAVLKGQTNGRLPAHLLHAVKMPGGGRDALLVEPAARCFRAMVAAAADDGLLLMCTEGYRPYETQVALHLDRYYVVNFKTDRYWDGRYWLKRPGVAVAAKPGTSNHGWGLAVDLAEQLDGDPQPESISDRAVAWLIANAGRYGISAEIQSEPWHWRMYTGDAIPAAVLAYEEDDMALTQEEHDHLEALAWRKYSEQQLSPVVLAGPTKGEAIPLVEALVDIRTRLAALEAKPAPPGSVDLAPVLAALSKVQQTVDRLVASEKAQAQALG